MTGVALRRPLDRLLAARSVVVVGASRDPERIGGRPLRYLAAQGFPGQVYAVNPAVRDIDGVPSFPDVRELPEAVDLAIVCLPAAACVDALEACVERGIGAAVVFSGGFAEAGAEGAELQRRLAETAERGGIALCGPNSVGFVNFGQRLPATFAAPLARPAESTEGDVAFVVQSGAVGTFLYDWARERALPISHFVSVGNEAVLRVGDYAGHLLAAPEVGALGVHLEGLRHGPSLLRAARAAIELEKPVCVLKSGRSAAGRRAALSHTGALAGSDRVATDVFAQHAMIRVDDPQDMLDFLELSRRLKDLPADPAVGIVSTSGGMGVWVADLLEPFGIPVPTFADATRERLEALLPAYGSSGNPVDMTGEIVHRPELASESLAAVLDDPDVSAAVLMIAYQRLHGAWIAEQVAEIVSRATKPVLIVWMFIEPEHRAILERTGVPLFTDPGRGIRALGRLLSWGRRVSQLRARRPPAAPTGGSAVPAPGGPEVLTEHQSKAMLADAGFQVPPSRLVSTSAEAARAAGEIGYPVVLKGQAAGVGHKMAHGLVALDVGDEAALIQAFTAISGRLRALASGPAILVERQAPIDTEVIVGSHRDEEFGHVVMFGAGGRDAEQLADVAFRALPLDDEEARAMIRSTAAGRALCDGPPGVDRERATVAALVAISQFTSANAHWVESVEVNPLAFAPGATQAVALDALIVRGGNAAEPIAAREETADA